jgi:hypothetical protein
MAKFTGKNMVATFGAAAIAVCITSVEVSETADVYTASCAGSSYKVRAIGPIDASFTVNYLADTTGSEDTALRPGTSGTFTASLNGTAWGQYSTASAYIESHTVSAPVDGFVTGTVVIGVDGALTVA